MPAKKPSSPKTKKKTSSKSTNTKKSLVQLNWKAPDEFNDLIYSRDGNVLFSCGQKKTRGWDKEGKEISCITSRSHQFEVSISYDNELLTRGSNNLTIWSISSGKKVPLITPVKKVDDVFFSPTAPLLALTTEKFLILWDYEKDKVLWKKKGWWHTVSFSGNGKQIAIYGEETEETEEIEVIDTLTGKVSMTVGGAHNFVQFFPNKDALLFLRERGVQIFDLKDGKKSGLKLTPNLFHGIFFSNATLSSDGKTLATWGTDLSEGTPSSQSHIAAFWDLESCSLLDEFRGKNPIDTLVFQPGELKVALGTSKYEIYILELPKSKAEAEVKTKAKKASLSPQVKEYVDKLESCGWFKEMSKEAKEQITEDISAVPRGKELSLALEVQGLEDYECIYDEGEYTSILESFAEKTYGVLSPQNIEENWDEDNYSISFSFENHGKTYRMDFEISDWVDEDFINFLNKACRNVNKSLCFIEGVDCGQGCTYFFTSRAAHKKAVKAKLIPKC